MEAITANEIGGLKRQKKELLQQLVITSTHLQAQGTEPSDRVGPSRVVMMICITTGWQSLVFDSLLARTFFRLKRGELHAPQAAIYKSGPTDSAS
jgi:hypothetical protein